MKNLDDAGKLAKIYRISFRNGRRISAFVFDSMFIGAACVLAVYISVRPHFETRKQAYFVTLVCALILFVLVRIADRERYGRHVEKTRKEAKKEIARLKLLTDPEALYKLIPPSENVFVSANPDGVTAEELLLRIRSGPSPVTVVSAVGATEGAKKLLKLYGDRARIATPEEFGADPEAVFKTSEEETDRFIIRANKELLKKPGLKKGYFRLTKERAVKYLAVGGALLVMSFFGRYSLYYRLAGSLILSLGGYVFAAEALKKNKGAPARDAP